MMVNNATNINKTNNSLKPLNLKKPMIYGVENSGPSLGEAHKCGRIKAVSSIPNPPFLIIPSPTTTQI